MGIWEKIFEFLGGQIGESAVNAWRQNSAIDSNIETLRLALPNARLLIDRSECWRSPKYNPIDELLPKLKDAVYEAESLVDEFLYRGLKNEVEKSLPGGCKSELKMELSAWARRAGASGSGVAAGETVQLLLDDVEDGGDQMNGASDDVQTAGTIAGVAIGTDALCVAIGCP